MTDDERKKMLDGFQQNVQDEAEDDPWTEEEILKAVKRIIERLGIDGELQ